MIKLLGALMILFGCSYIGIIKSCSLKNRRKELLQLQKAVHILESEIMYLYTEVPYIFLKIGENIGEGVGKIFQTAGKSLINGDIFDVYNALNDAASKNKFNTHLENKDLEIIMDLGKVLGKWDIESHKNEFIMAKNMVDENLEESKKNEIKMSKMYTVLGVTFGLTICILLI